jgi:sec-independent protein translocase protein TatC
MAGESLPGGEQPLLHHLLELRTRFLSAMYGVLAVFLPMAIFAKELYGFFAKPLVQLLPAGTSMIATKVISPFLTPLKLSAFAALFLAMPWVLYQAWGFIAPGLYRSERKLLAPLLVRSEERSVGKECRRLCRSRWSPYH